MESTSLWKVVYAVAFHQASDSILQAFLGLYRLPTNFEVNAAIRMRDLCNASTVTNEALSLRRLRFGPFNTNRLP
jgi:hypothetical protein